MTTEVPAAAPRRGIRQTLGSIRVRIVVAYVCLLVAALAIAVLVTRQVLLSRLADEIDDALAQEIEELRALAGGTDPETGEPFGNDARAIFDTFLSRSIPSDDEAFYTLVDGEPWKRSFAAPSLLLDDADLVERWAAVTETTRLTASTSAGEARMLIVPLRADDTVHGTLVVAHFPADDRAEIAQVIRVITVAGLLVTLVSGAVAWSIAGRVLRPVRELTDTTRRITESDLSARIPVEGHDELAELGRTFNAMVTRLDDGFRGQRQFLDDVAHELRTPITIARGHLDVLGDDPVERAETIEIVTDELDRMGRYVSELLVLAKAEQPDFLRVGDVDVGDLVDDLVQRASALAPRRWVADTQPRAGELIVVADVGRLTQAMLNLASNAVQHTAAGDEIGIGARHTTDTVELWVRDTGPGIDPSVAEDLFRRYSRGATSRATRPEGTGIGLSIVDAIARAHGGSVDVDPGPGRGATFIITLARETSRRSPATQAEREDGSRSDHP